LNTSRFIKLSAWAGIIGPIFFGTMLFTLTYIKYDFLLSLGWDPLHAPTLDWPSGLALGPFGWVMTATFVLCGAMMSLFSVGLYLTLQNKFGTVLMMFAGLALMGLAFTTDPTMRSTPTTWHGQLHDLSFVLLGLTLMPAMIVLGFTFRRLEHWRNLSFYTWLTASLALPAFFIKGSAFYIFLFAVLFWDEVVAPRLKSNT
jgi:hypothetical protein